MAWGSGKLARAQRKPLWPELDPRLLGGASPPLPECTQAGTRARVFSLMLRVKVDVDEAKLGCLIGERGATVRQIQIDTGSQIRTPRRGEKRPVEITGPDVVSVLRGCALVARCTRPFHERSFAHAAPRASTKAQLRSRYCALARLGLQAELVAVVPTSDSCFP